MPEGVQFIQGNRLCFGERSNGGPPQLGNVSNGSQRRGNVAGKGTHVGAFAGNALEFGVVAVGLAEQDEPFDDNRARFELHLNVGARQRICSTAFDLDRRVRGRYLLDVAGEPWEHILDLGGIGSAVARFDDHPFRIVRCPRLAPTNGKAVGLGAIHHIGDGFGRLPERHRKNARRERIKGATVASLRGASGAAHPRNNSCRTDP